MTYRCLIDLETTGFSVELDQVTEIAAIIEDSNGKVVDKYEAKVRLYKNCLPSIGALMVTGINPFSKEWNDSAVTLFEAATGLYNFCKKYTKDGKLIFTAYNTPFDEPRLYHLLKICLLDPTEIFHSEAFDPLITARILVEKGLIQTKLKKRSTGGYYNSATLGDVAVGLGLITEEKLKGLHRAMEDTELMQKVIHKLYQLSTGLEYKNLKCDTSSFKKGDYVVATTNHPVDGIKKHDLIISSNDKINKKVVAIDLDVWEKQGLDNSSMKIFNFSDFMSGKLEKKEEFSSNFYERNKSKIHMLSNLLNEADEADETKKPEQSYNFDVVRETYQKLQNNEKIEKNSFVVLADRLSLFQGEKGFSHLYEENLQGITDNFGVVEGEIKNVPVKILMHPSGYYVIKANEKTARAHTKGDIGIKIQSLIDKAPKGGKTVKALLDQLEVIKNFKNESHPLAIRESLKSYYEADTDYSHQEKAILDDTYSYYNGLYPKIFKNLK